MSHLLNCNAREPQNKISELRAIFQVLEKSCDRNSGTAKHPHTTYAVWVSLYCSACVPIDHDSILRRWSKQFNAANVPLTARPRWKRPAGGSLSFGLDRIGLGILNSFRGLDRWSP
jgi:hypothetical protein